MLVKATPPNKLARIEAKMDVQRYEVHYICSLLRASRPRVHCENARLDLVLTTLNYLERVRLEFPNQKVGYRSPLRISYVTLSEANYNKIEERKRWWHSSQEHEEWFFGSFDLVLTRSTVDKSSLTQSPIAGASIVRFSLR